MRDLNHAHPMLEPLNYNLDPEAASQFLEENQLKVYTLLWQASMATHLEGPVTRAHQLKTKINDTLSLCLKWQELLESGWGCLLTSDFSDESLGAIKECSYENLPFLVPPYNKNDLVSRSQLQNINFIIAENSSIEVQVKTKAKTTTTASEPYLTYALLLDSMVAYKVARASTYANALHAVIKNDLLLERHDCLVLSANGQTLYEKISKLPDEEQLNSHFSYAVETAIEKIEQHPEEAGSLLNQFCQQLFKCDTELAQWIDGLEIDGQILVSADVDNTLAASLKMQKSAEIKSIEELQTSVFDSIVNTVSNVSKISWNIHAWNDFAFCDKILDISFLGRLKALEIPRLDLSQEQLFETCLKDFISMVHLVFCSSIPMIELLKSLDFYVLTDRVKGIGYLKTLQLVYYKDIFAPDCETIKKALIRRFREARFYCLRLALDVDCLLKVTFE